VVPSKIGRLAADGTVTERLDYDGQRQISRWRLVFDCFEPVGGFTTCGQGEPDGSSPNDFFRWRMGDTYHNEYVTNDMEFDPAYGGWYAEGIGLCWDWHVEGPGTSENCAIVVETWEDFDGTCQIGDPNGFGDWLGIVVLYFGDLEANSGPFGYDYYWTQVDLCGLDWLPVPADGAGAYSIRFLTWDDDDPNTLYPATCAQPMLWGTGDGEWPIPDDVGRGRMSHQGPRQWDDINRNGLHDAPEECIDYSSDEVCPNPLGAMFCFWVAVECVGDIDGDDDTDEADLGILLAKWDSHWHQPGWDSRADLDINGYVGQSDLGILLAYWGCGT
jgi:hypothetical protein